MSHFRRALAQVQPARPPARWVLVPYDQLQTEVGPLAQAPPGEVGVVVVEGPQKAARRPYHQQKLAWVLASTRQFALEQARAGRPVQAVVAAGSWADALRPVARALGGLVVQRPAERELRADLQPLIDEGLLREVPNETWLTTAADLAAAGSPGPPWRMDAFYRQVRRRTGWLMDGGKPRGGRFSFDGENREPWRGQPPAPVPPRFPADEVTQEVGDLVRTRYAHHPGRLDLEALPTTAAQVEQAWSWAKSACLPHFGPYEDALSDTSRGLFHTRISPLLNAGRLLPRRVLAEATALDLPLASLEGFGRQILGWREFVHQVHEATDGFRTLAPAAPAPGDGGWAGWAGRAWPGPQAGDRADGGATPNFLGAAAPVPPAWWGQPSGLRCLDQAVQTVWEDAYTHHIARLMVLSNLATLLDVEPRALTDWFWAAYLDAQDWVVEPNVLGMGTFGAGPVLTTKPYLSGSAYLDRMGDHCARCRFRPKVDCPITPLYWSFLHRHREKLADNERMKLPLASARKQDAARQAADAEVARWVSRALSRGEELRPEDHPSRRPGVPRSP